jgi:hypothetical protein
MKTLQLLSIPNQELSFAIGDNYFTLRLRTFRDITFASISMNDELLCGSMRCMPNTPIFNGNINSIINGKLMFECLNGVLPNYKNFDGVTCVLKYIPYS